MDFMKCWDCSPPIQPWVITVLSAITLLFVWQSMRPQRRPHWWRSVRKHVR